MSPGLIAGLAVPIMRAFGATYRWRVDGDEHYDAILASGRQPVMVFWHGRILPATLYFRHRGIVVMTSRSDDGEWIAQIIERFGYGTARGSTSKGGAKALVQMRRDLLDGKPAGFAIDGPRGPARVAQPGAVFLAGATGHPILPFHLEANHYWEMNSWDRTQVPKPFARIGLAIGEPIDVASTDDTEIERGRLEIERVLAALEHKARQLSLSTGDQESRRI